MDDQQTVTFALEAWHAWMAGAILLFISELLTPGGFLLASLGVGALVTSLIAAFDPSLNIQITCFAICSLIIYLAIRPVYLKALSKGRDEKPTGAAAYIGREGSVVEDLISGAGRIELGGESWKARTDSSETLHSGARVRVTGMDGLTLIVTRIEV